jgi:chemotaxis-related protein WspB
MQVLLFEVARQRYGLDVSQIIEVVPAVRLRPIPGVPPYVAGIMQYRGALAPVLDVSRLLCGTPAAPRFSTRLVMVRQYTTSRTKSDRGKHRERAPHGVSDELREIMT